MTTDVTLLKNNSPHILTVFRGEKGDPGDGSSFINHENDTNSHADIRRALALKATTYTHTQTIMSTSWTVNHNLNRYPSVTVILADGSEVKGDTIHNGYNVLSIVFAVPIVGVAHCV